VSAWLNGIHIALPLEGW